MMPKRLTRIPSVTTFRMAGIGITILGGGSINSTYSTSLDSTEFNLHKVVNDRLTFFSGFRAIELRDSLRANIATPATFARWTEENYMYGGQVGTNWALLDPQSPFRLNLSLKGGAYNNEMRNRFTSTIVSSDFEEDNEISFVGEGSLNATYFMTDTPRPAWWVSGDVARQRGTGQRCGGSHGASPRGHIEPRDHRWPTVLQWRHRCGRVCVVIPRPANRARPN